MGRQSLGKNCCRGIRAGRFEEQFFDFLRRQRQVEDRKFVEETRGKLDGRRAGADCQGHIIQQAGDIQVQQPGIVPDDLRSSKRLRCLLDSVHIESQQDVVLVLIGIVAGSIADFVTDRDVVRAAKTQNLLNSIMGRLIAGAVIQVDLQHITLGGEVDAIVCRTGPFGPLGKQAVVGDILGRAEMQIEEAERHRGGGVDVGSVGGLHELFASCVDDQGQFVLLIGKRTFDTRRPIDQLASVFDSAGWCRIQCIAGGFVKGEVQDRLRADRTLLSLQALQTKQAASHTDHETQTSIPQCFNGHALTSSISHLVERHIKFTVYVRRLESITV